MDQDMIENPIKEVVDQTDDQLDIELEEEKDSKRNLVINQIDKLYANVIEKFQQADMLVYNANILSKITKQKFIGWIIYNNKEIAELFN